MTAGLLRLALGLVHAEGALDHVAALLDLAVVLVTEFVLGELLALLDPLVDLILVLARKVLGLPRCKSVFRAALGGSQATICDCYFERLACCM